MKICLLTVGETHKKWAMEAEKEYAGRLSRYVGFERIIIPDIKATKSLSQEQQKMAEGRRILERILPTDCLILLDERGGQLGSFEFSVELQGFMNRGIRKVVYAVGGPYGFSDDVYARAGDNLFSLSKMTFPHDLVRVVFLEQLYRAFTIIRNEPYHHG